MADAVKTTDFQPIETAPRETHVVVRGSGLEEQASLWGKVSHVPIYGWFDMGTDDPEDTSLLRPAPTEWRHLTAEERGAVDL